MSALALVAVLLLPVLALVVTPDLQARDVRGLAGTTWLSAEAGGRVVLASAGGDRPSVAVELSDQPGSFDVVDIDGAALVHDRSTGQLLVIDGRDGTELDRTEGPAAADRALVVAAGAAGYAVDPVAGTARRVESDGRWSDPVAAPGRLTAWVGTADGLLWLLDADGRVLSFDGARFVERQSAREGRLVLTAVDDEPVLLDRDVGVLRWPRLGASVPLDGAAEALLQEPALGSTCVTIASSGRLRCIAPDAEVVEDVVLDLVPDPSARLFASDRNAVVAWADRDEILAVHWASGSVDWLGRPTPSSRPPIATQVAGALLLDDPGSRYAVTIARNRVVPSTSCHPTRS
jgi:hypothetical protein